MLRRSITPLHATALVVGIIIGASIFVQPSVITGAVPSLTAVYAVWIASGVLTLFAGIYVYAQATGHWHTYLPERVYFDLIPHANEFAHP